jgi:hypothetical protein
MKKLFWSNLIILLASCVCVSQTFSDNFTTPEGHKLQAIAKVEKETIMFGETTYIVFEIKNLSNVDFYTGVGGDYRNNIGRPDSYGVKVVGDNGNPVPQPKVTYWGGGLFGSETIPANGSYKVRLYLPHWATFEKTGDYTITVSRVFSIKNKNELRSSEIFEKPKVSFYAKATTKIKIVPTNQDELGKVIDDLGTKMLDISKEKVSRDEEPQRDAANLLQFIDDNRTINYFAKAIEIYSVSDEWRYNWNYRRLALALSKFKDDSALNALKKVMNSKNDDLRLDVADALTYSKHPNALKTLLQMQNDSYYFVRLRVVQAYGKIETEESTALLRKMINDEHEWVREQAKSFLDKRKQK